MMKEDVDRIPLEKEGGWVEAVGPLVLAALVSAPNVVIVFPMKEESPVLT